MGNKAKDDDLYQKCAAWWVKSCWKCVTWVRSRNIVIAGVLRTSLANRKIQRSPLTVEAMEKVIHALSGH